MAKGIPNNYDYKSEAFDSLEMIVRDDLSVNIENWAKFRHTITASASSTSLRSINSQSISEEVKQSYIELSKSHYEAVTMLGATKLSLNNAKESLQVNPLIFKKSFKEFYMHAGSVLDNIARLIYIINIPNAVFELDRWGNYKRHSIGYGSLDTIRQNSNSQLRDTLSLLRAKT